MKRLEADALAQVKGIEKSIAAKKKEVGTLRSVPSKGSCGRGALNVPSTIPWHYPGHLVTTAQHCVAMIATQDMGCLSVCLTTGPPAISVLSPEVGGFTSKCRSDTRTARRSWTHSWST